MNISLNILIFYLLCSGYTPLIKAVEEWEEQNKFINNLLFSYFQPITFRVNGFLGAGTATLVSDECAKRRSEFRN